MPTQKPPELLHDILSEKRLAESDCAAQFYRIIFTLHNRMLPDGAEAGSVHAKTASSTQTEPVLSRLEAAGGRESVLPTKLVSFERGLVCRMSRKLGVEIIVLF